MFDKSASSGRRHDIRNDVWKPAPDTGTPSMSACKKMRIYIHELFAFATYPCDASMAAQMIT